VACACSEPAASSDTINDSRKALVSEFLARVDGRAHLSIVGLSVPV